jgi:hypothetical protein
MVYKRVPKMHFSTIFLVIDGNCCVYRNSTRNRDGLVGGVVRLWNENYSLHKLLFKIFRKEVYAIPMEKLVLTSRRECRTGK